MSEKGEKVDYMVLFQQKDELEEFNYEHQHKIQIYSHFRSLDFKQDQILKLYKTEENKENLAKIFQNEIKTLNLIFPKELLTRKTF